MFILPSCKSQNNLETLRFQDLIEVRKIQEQEGYWFRNLTSSVFPHHSQSQTSLLTVVTQPLVHTSQFFVQLLSTCYCHMKTDQQSHSCFVKMHVLLWTDCMNYCREVTCKQCRVLTSILPYDCNLYHILIYIGQRSFLTVSNVSANIWRIETILDIVIFLRALHSFIMFWHRHP